MLFVCPLVFALANHDRTIKISQIVEQASAPALAYANRKREDKYRLYSEYEIIKVLQFCTNPPSHH